jgi:hypothetical protein
MSRIRKEKAATFLMLRLPSFTRHGFQVKILILLNSAGTTQSAGRVFGPESMTCSLYSGVYPNLTTREAIQKNRHRYWNASAAFES